MHENPLQTLIHFRYLKIILQIFREAKKEVHFALDPQNFYSFFGKKNHIFKKKLFNHVKLYNFSLSLKSSS